MRDQIIIKCPPDLKDSFLNWFWRQGEQEFLETVAVVWDPRIEDYVKNPNTIIAYAGKESDIIIEEEPFVS